MANNISRTPVREQDPVKRAANFEEVCYGFNIEEASREASRCLHCRVPRCRAACPVEINIPQFIASVSDGDYRMAARIIAEDSLLPSICGRVCPQESQCEGACILGIKGEPVSIGKLERFVGDWELENGEAEVPQIESNRHRIAVVGSGPAGLACAADLAKKGYAVTVFEALHRLGGVLSYGIPEFRLPKKKIVEREIAKVAQLGVKFETNIVVGRTVTVDSLFAEGFEAVFIGSGAGLPKFMHIAGENLNGVFSANEFLTRINLMGAYAPDRNDTPVWIGRRVAVVGGGNVAMDAVRCAKRLGAEAVIVYRRSETELPARAEEVHHAKEEGIRFEMLTNPTGILGDEKGWVRALRCVRMELGEPDQSGRRSPVEIVGSEFEIECDTVIMALGTSPNPLIATTTEGLECSRKGTLVADPTGATTREGVFGGGDAITGAATVILAMGAGRTAAKSIDTYISEKYENQN